MLSLHQDYSSGYNEGYNEEVLNMADNTGIDIVVVGSIALDSIATPAESRTDVLGGSVSFACAAASFFAKAGMVGVVGSDFPEGNVKLLERFGIDLRGLERAEGSTFRWSGVYEKDMNNRRTISTDLNVFASFSPDLPQEYRTSPFLFLANIAPSLQLNVLKQIRSPRFVAADTMDLWIKIAKPELMKVLKKVDLLLINDSEVRELTGEGHLVKAARLLLDQGPRHVLIKKGEHGGMLVSRDRLFLIPAYPVENVVDPTGAGDAFAGGMMGFLSKLGKITSNAMRMAMIAGTVTASFAVESFGLEKLASVERSDVDKRMRDLLDMVRVRGK
jgi:cytidine kinase